jgi:Tfp pilus assembly protein PilE
MLIEMMDVIAIYAILAAITKPSCMEHIVKA